MQRVFSERLSCRLLPAVLILFILEVLTLPVVLGLTYSGRSESPNHFLTYTQGKLTWDSATGIDKNGAAELSLFDAVYENAEASDGENIVAPGTEGFNIVRFKNDVSGSVDYKAVLYRIRTNDQLPVEAALEGESFTDTEDYPLPEGVTADQVLRAVGGTVSGGEIVDFDISWNWQYEEAAEQDTIDTILGNEAESDEVTVGLYIVVEDNNEYVIPTTGDDSTIEFYVTLMLISFVLLVILLIERRKDKKCEQ